MYKLFGDRDVDDQIRKAENNVDVHETHERNARDHLEKLGHLCAAERAALEALNSFRISAESSRVEGKSEFSRLGDTKRVSNQTWSAIRKLIESPEYQTTRDSCLRHILDLTHTQFDVIDADADVQRFKQGIDDEIRRVLGDATWKELEEAKSALPESEYL